MKQHWSTEHHAPAAADAPDAEAQYWRELGDAMRAEMERPEAFWARQRLVMGCRIDERPPSRSRRALWASAALAAVTGAALWVGVPRARHSPVPIPQAASSESGANSEISDEALLAQLHAALNRDAPAALAPVEVIAVEWQRSAQRQTHPPRPKQISTKEF